MSHPTRALTKEATAAHMGSEADLVGKKVGVYEILRPIGNGGMGEVFEAQHEHLQKRCAIKFIQSQMLKDSQAIERFRAEIRSLGALDHPNILHAIDAGEWNGIPYLVTELLSGTDLYTTIVQNGPAPPDVACQWIRQVALGLQYAHAKGFVHRDIKPSNLVLLSDGSVKIVDFGLVRNADADTNTMTVAGQFLGSVDFLAPEQADDPRHATEQSDIYSLGCTFVFLLSGSAPFEDSLHESVLSKLKGHSLETPKWLRDPCPGIREDIRNLVRDMVQKAPKDRIKCCSEIILRLDRISGDSSDSPHKTNRFSWIRWKRITAAGCIALAAWFSYHRAQRRTGSSPISEMAISTKPNLKSSGSTVQDASQFVKSRSNQSGPYEVLDPDAPDVREGEFNSLQSTRTQEPSDLRVKSEPSTEKMNRVESQFNFETRSGSIRGIRSSKSFQIRQGKEN